MPDEQPAKSAYPSKTSEYLWKGDNTEKIMLRIIKITKDNGWVVRINDWVVLGRKASLKFQENLYFNVMTKIKCQ